ncbi:MAG TPA: NAD(P)-dependent oxidoreductase [Steroidobacteraceae bacterium]|nr:NAD(P)-dependent oxidoreductase [Steroidobacteraceae bacterium]
MGTRRVLVTGAGGFIGRWSVPRLLELGFEVHALRSPETSRETPVELAGARLHRTDLLGPGGAAGLVRSVRPSHLLHFAWIATPGIYAGSPANRLWLEASRALLREFLDGGGERAVIAGSCAEYAPTGAGPCIERRTALADEGGGTPSPYAACKLALQRDLQAAGRRAGASTAWGRIFLQLGPGEHPARLVSSVIRHLLAGQEAACTHGRQVRGFLHVADVGAAFAALLASQVEGPVNVGSDRSITIAGLVDMIAARIGRPDLIRRGALPAPVQEVPVLVADAARLRGEVGWSPRFGLEDAVLDAICWWRKEWPC